MLCCAVLCCAPGKTWHGAVLGCAVTDPAEFEQVCCGLQDLRGLHERLQVEIQETFTDFLGSISKDPAKNTGIKTLCFLMNWFEPVPAFALASARSPGVISCANWICAPAYSTLRLRCNVCHMQFRMVQCTPWRPPHCLS